MAKLVATNLIEVAFKRYHVDLTFVGNALQIILRMKKEFVLQTSSIRFAFDPIGSSGLQNFPIALPLSCTEVSLDDVKLVVVFESGQLEMLLSRSDFEPFEVIGSDLTNPRNLLFYHVT